MQRSHPRAWAQQHSPPPPRALLLRAGEVGRQLVELHEPGLGPLAVKAAVTLALDRKDRQAGTPAWGGGYRGPGMWGAIEGLAGTAG